KAAADITSQMKRLPMLALPVSTAELDRPELRAIPDSELASMMGVTTEAIAEAVRIATIGDVGPALARFTLGDRQIPLRVQLEGAARASRHVIEALRVATASGGAVPLSSVARFEVGQGPTSTDRYDRARRVAPGADLAGATPLGEAVAAVTTLPAARNLP